jgi:hypothetical protein
MAESVNTNTDARWYWSAEEAGLKPCPFCGPGQSVVTLYITEFKYWTVGCGRCGSHSGQRPVRDDQGRDKVVTVWNRRPMEPFTADPDPPSAQTTHPT